MKIESLDLHGLSLDEAIGKTKQNLAWCMKHGVDVLDINHGKGYHSSRSFSVIKQEVRRMLKTDRSIRDYGYKIIYGESDFPLTLKYDAGHTLIVKKGLENKHLGGYKQHRKDTEIFSSETKQRRKIQKKVRATHKKRNR